MWRLIGCSVSRGTLVLAYRSTSEPPLIRISSVGLHLGSEAPTSINDSIRDGEENPRGASRARSCDLHTANRHAKERKEEKKEGKTASVNERKKASTNEKKKKEEKKEREKERKGI